MPAIESPRSGTFAIRREHKLSSLVVSFACFFYVVMPADASPTTKPNPAPGWTIARICAALEWRESKLRQSTFTFSEEHWAETDSGTRKMLECFQFDARYKGRTLRYTVSSSHLNPDPDLDVDHSIQSWDGAVCKTFMRFRSRSGEIQLRGGTRDYQPDLLLMTSFFDVLGMHVGSNDISESQWLRGKLKMHGTVTTITEERDGSDACVKLVVKPGGEPLKEIRYVFLPQNDFVIKRRMLRTVGGDGQPRATDEYAVNDLAQFDGLWMPAKTTVRLSSGKSRDLRTCELHSLSLTPPTEQDMQVPFPAGTRVMDSVNHQCYVVKPDGGKEFQEFFDAATGKLVSPTTEPSTASGAGG